METNIGRNYRPKILPFRPPGTPKHDDLPNATRPRAIWPAGNCNAWHVAKTATHVLRSRETTASAMRSFTRGIRLCRLTARRASGLARHTAWVLPTGQGPGVRPLSLPVACLGRNRRQVRLRRLRRNQVSRSTATSGTSQRQVTRALRPSKPQESPTRSFHTWNPAVSSDCVDGFWVGEAYCVGVAIASSASTTPACTDIAWWSSELYGVIDGMLHRPRTDSDRLVLKWRPGNY